MDSAIEQGFYNSAKKLSESDVEQLCGSIYDYLYDDEYHMLIIDLYDFSEWDFAYYTGDEAALVFDKQAGDILTSLANKENSFQDMPTVLKKTTDIIMTPPFKFYGIIFVGAAIVVLLVYLVFKNSKKIKSGFKSKKNDIENGATETLKKIDSYTVKEFKEFKE